mgnify:CR=1 FL=1
MAGVSDENGGNAEGVKDAARDAESPAARRRRIEKMREKQELRALLDDFGDGDLDPDLDLELEDEADDSQSRYVAADAEEDIDLDEDDLSDDDDDSFDDEFEEDD